MDGVIALVGVLLAFVLGRVGKAQDIRGAQHAEALAKLDEKLDKVGTSTTTLTAQIGPVALAVESAQATLAHTVAKVAALEAWKMEHDRWSHATVEQMTHGGPVRRASDMV